MQIKTFEIAASGLYWTETVKFKILYEP